ncbi:MAG: ion channel [Salinimicrobium sediminis]|nr:ion channel [Salinimicrobium sediminis]
MNILVLSIGLLLLVLIICDFFFTTLSGSGAGFISKPVASFAYRGLRKFSGPSNRRVFKYSGLIVNLAVLLIWILIVWFGLFLVFSSNPDGITNSNSRPANWVERLYYTGYIISTLGLGNFKPTTAFFEIITSIFSFFGFIFFTSSMTYLISVSSAVIRKRTLSRSIFNLGSSPSEMAEKLLALNPSYRDQQLLRLQEEIDKHMVSHQAYPVVHFYSHQNPDNCFSINFVRLDEALNSLLNGENNEKPHPWQKEELQLLRSTMTNLIMHLKDNFKGSLPEPKTIATKANGQLDLSNLQQRRSVLSSMLRSEGFSWENLKGS